MFDISFSELALIVIIAIIAIGPKELPQVMRTIARVTRQIRRTATDFKREVEDAIYADEIKEFQKNMEATMENAGLDQISDAERLVEEKVQAGMKKLEEEMKLKGDYVPPASGGGSA
jgi:sec-independent protein translocase protein TatB